MDILLAIKTIVILTVGWFVTKVTQEKLNNPDKSLLMVVVNVALGPLRYFNLFMFKEGVPTMEKDMKRVSAKTGLTDYGDLQFVQNYKYVTDTEFFKRLKLTNLGYVSAQKEVDVNLTKRLKLIDFLKKNPQVYDIPIKRPIFVFGLGRSGTTYVHRLLSMDPKLRAPRLWELLAPTPMISGDSTVAEFAADRAHRNKIVRDAVAKRTKLGVSAMDQFHEIGADLPEECMMGVSTDLPTCFQYLYTCLCQPQIFTDNIKGKPVVDAYKRYKSILQLLSYQTKVNDDDDGSGHNRNWLLKFPVHILFIKELAEAFPDARMIWAHRHPLPTVASLSAMMCALHSIYYEKETCDPKEVGENMAELCDKALVKAIKDLEETGLETSHVIFNNLVEDPISVVKGIYKDLNMEYTQEFEDNMIAYMKQNNAERAILKAKVEATGKIFDYQDPADYGLSLDGLLQKKGYHKYLDSFHFDSIK